MAYATKLWFLSLLYTLFSPKFNNVIHAKALLQQVPCYFVFGDSLADNGNNNNLKTQAKVNYLPYGIDFRDGPTGRFTNGRNYADVIGEFVGVGDIPPFAASEGKHIMNGVNYASGGCGILPETGRNVGEVISFDQQLINHNVTISRVNAALGGDKKKTVDRLNKCLYTVGFGSNDYINNYLMPKFFPNSRLYTPDQYAQNLIRKYSNQLTTLYNYGARKIAVYGLGPIGCIPQETLTNKPNLLGCVDSTNQAVQLFNGKLRPLVDGLNAKLVDAHFIYINVSNFSPFIGSLNSPCCKITQAFGAAGQCIPNQIPCSLRMFKPFFDGFHPTETGHLLLAGRSYVAISPLDAYPYDIRHLVHI